jgi:dihydroxyacetone synthase
MPKLLYMRPWDSEEVAGAFEIAIKANETPSIIFLSPQALPQWKQSSRSGFAKGAYVFVVEEEFDVALISTGVPCPRLFEQQTRDYKQSVLKPKAGKPTVVIESYAANGWERYADAAISMRCFGKSLPSKTAYEYFGFQPSVMTPKIKDLDGEIKRDGIEILRGDFRDLNGALGIGFEH